MRPQTAEISQIYQTSLGRSKFNEIEISINVDEYFKNGNVEWK